MLRSAAAAGVAVPLARPLHGAEVGAQRRTTLPAFTVPVATFSVAERDRRWAAVRANMAGPRWNLDAIITAGSDQSGNGGHNARYLTQIVIQKGSEGPEVLCPRDPAKPVVAHLPAIRYVDEWIRRLQPGRWLADGKLVLKPESGSTVLATSIKAQGYDRPGTRIGVATLKGSRFFPEGLVSHTWFENLNAALPGVVFLPVDQFPPQVGNDTGPIEDASMSKSAEEIEMIRKAVAVNERAIAAAIEAVRNGAARQADLWWAAFQAMYSGCGEDIVRCSIGFNGGGNNTIGDPVDMPVRVGQICNQEISAAYQGYGCQINHAFFVGTPSTPGYEYYRAAIELLVKVHERAIAFIRPGKTTYGDFQANNEKVFTELGEKGSGTNTHGGGIHFLSRPRQSPEDNLVVMQPGHTFDFKPAVTLDRARVKDVGDKSRPVQLGESILVTDKGAVRLGTRSLVPIAAHA